MSNPENFDEHLNYDLDTNLDDDPYSHLIKDLGLHLPMQEISCITNTTMDHVLNELSSSEYRIDFDEERVKRIFNLAINAFDEFSKDEDSF